MKTIKRSGIALALALVLLLSGCAGKESGEKSAGNLDPNTPVTVTLWHYYVGENQQELEEAVSSFNQTVGMENGVIVESVAVGSIAELEENVTNSAKGVINAQPMPQIFSSYPDKAQEIDALDMLVDLRDYFTPEERALYVEDFLEDGSFGEGRLLVLPIVKSTELLYVNATNWDAFAEAAGLDAESLATWEGVLDTAREYYWHTSTDEGARTVWDGAGLMGFDSLANYIIIGNKQLGVDVIDAGQGEGGAAVLDEATMRRVFDTYFVGYSLGYFDAIGKFRSDDIKAGDLIAYVGSSSSAAYFPTWIEKDNTQSPIDFLPLAYPMFEGGKPYAIQQGAGMCVAKSTPAQQEGSALFLKWFTQSEQNIAFAMTTGYLPVQRSAYESDELTSILEGLAAGNTAEQNVAGVYGITLHQITQASTYAAKPFEGSYSVRSTLQSTLIDAALDGREAAAPLKAQGMTEAEILEALDVEDRFQTWMQTLRDQLDGLWIERSALSEPS